jgi:hypothetical protein
VFENSCNAFALINAIATDLGGLLTR